MLAVGIGAQAKQVQRLHVEGTKLVNEKGETTVLKGISYGWHCIWPYFWNPECCDYIIKEWHPQVVRAAMGVAKSNEGEMKDNYRDNPAMAITRLCDVVDTAIKNDVYVIIDWHSHDIFTEDAVKFFKVMAEKYKGVPNVIYEIFNEPDYESWAEVKEYSETVIKAIRDIEKDAIILVGCPHWDQDVDKIADDRIKGYDNLMYTMHFYAATHKKALRDRTDVALKKGLPIFVSECAGMEASGDGPLDMKEWNDYISWMAANDLSWCAWSISDKVETCSMLVPGANRKGHWTDAEIKPWGRIVREELSK